MYLSINNIIFLTSKKQVKDMYVENTNATQLISFSSSQERFRFFPGFFRKACLSSKSYIHVILQFNGGLVSVALVLLSLLTLV